MLKKLFYYIWVLLKFPFKLIKQFLIRILKRLKFSITFKISVSYFLLYVVVILVVTVTTSVGYFIYILNDFKETTIDNQLNIIMQNIDNLERINDLGDDDNINNINIYNSNYRMIYSKNASLNNVKYTNNIILVVEEILKNKTYVHSAEFEINEKYYYVNIYYDVNFLISQTLYIIILVFISGILGLLIFIPIVSRTSGKLIKPIKKMTQITKTISVNNINTRLDIRDSQDELKELSSTFNEMMDRIEEGYKTQQLFVSDASHELRTPIAVIKGYVNMLDRWGKNDKDVLDESIQAIKNETENMQDLIEKLLFIARNDKHTLTFNKEDFKISEILYEIKKESSMIDTKHLYEFNFANDANVYADKNRIKQAIRIFIENAIKFTPEGGKIALYGYLDDEYYGIKIADSGIGIAKKDLSRIFDRLYRAEESRNRQIGGHGLGLSIAKIIIIGHKGKIKVKSTIGKGSEFTILIPHI
ncbi:HAMP domain-containing protein [Sedimentibacter sp. zth1]|uniref:sensor histidine kinase n=1 Tax=Sedimentibacter sp. zth1 TaxID=2816908 RepID=UPI001A922DC7|nr:HAMP domain-containing sensor histidine kinase [Sedimentibacter sp. zth1]QSX06385.1 HAMP domain-containing protein [Sedimentibacter sp. zth1]